MYRTQTPTCRTSCENTMAHDHSLSIPANIQKSSESIRIQLALPGYEKSEINVKVEQSDLIVSTQPSTDSTKYARKEFGKQTLKRVFRLPSSVLQDQIEAKFEQGILNILLRKESKNQSQINIL